MVNTIIAIPYRVSDPRRSELFDFVRTWFTQHHDWPIRLGSSPEGPFNRGAAINDAAHGDWDVMVVSDADNICDPNTLQRAVNLAHTTGKVVYPFTTYMYLDEYTSDRLMAGDNWFVAPELHPRHKFSTTVRYHHYSGIQAIPRTTWDKVGGFIELTGWGAEDAIMDTLFSKFGNGSDWLPGSAYHLWHPANRNDPNDDNNVSNHRIWAKVQNTARRQNPDVLRNYLASIGHHIPCTESAL